MILIVADHSQGKLNKITSEMVSAAHGLHAELPVAILVLGFRVANVAAEASKLAEQVLVADRAELDQYDPEVWTAAVSQVAREGDAEFVFIAGTRAGREYSARVAARLGGALLEEIVAIYSREGVVAGRRYTFLARVTEEIIAEARPVVATVKVGAFPPASLGGEAGEQFDVDLELPVPRVRIESRSNVRSARVPLEEADIVVSGGRGVGSAEGFTHFVEALADQLGAAVGATRAVVDAGWRPYSEQVGQTGKTVQPKAYIAIGISGAVQHLSGMNKSKYIIAINQDADCPMIRACDCGIVGKVADVVPALIEALRK